MTGWGNVRITRLSLVGDDGMRYSALMYVPKNATNETPAPGIMMYHGNSGNARNHESWAVEFSRRGFVVISIDNLGAGNGEYSGVIGYTATPKLFTDYMYSLPIVDTDNIIFSGHSMGANIVNKMALIYQPKACMNSDGGGGRMGADPFNVEEKYNGSYLVINGGADKLNQIDSYSALYNQAFANDGVKSADEPLVIDELYGSYEAGNAHMMRLVPNQIHEGAFVNNTHITYLLDFAQNCVAAPNYIDAQNTIWYWKDWAGLAGMVLFVNFIIQMLLWVLDTFPFFAGVRQEMPRNIGMRGKDLAISITCAVLFPVLTLYTGAFGLITLADALPIFHLRWTNISMPVVLALNLFGLIMFCLFHKVWGKKRFHATLRDYGLTSEGAAGMDWGLVGKSLFASMIAVGIGFAYMQLQSDVLGTDFYCQFFGFRAIPIYRVNYYIPYVIVWLLCFVVASLGMNVERRLPSTGNETADTAIAMVFNGGLATFGITAMTIIENAVQIHLGTSGVALASWGTDITRLWGMTVGMFLGGAGSTYVYRKTGSVWPGAFVMGFVCAMSACLYGQIQFGGTGF
ncbi:MAG: hypothetical protein LIO81_10485 [Clostridiales bacterium]|nr:hypothetical protein [Clostridiales bacterium]